MIPYGKQDLNETDLNAVIETLRSDWLTQGPVGPKFEQAVAQKVGAQYAVAVNSATSALHLACLALDLHSEDWLWTSPNTFVASANCALHCGAQVDFVDIDPKTYNMCAKALRDKLEKAEQLGKLPKIVMPVHFSGQACDMQAIHTLSKQYGFKIIEDASHAIGGQYQSKPIGNCVYSDITVFSFHPVKIITTGEGGLALTNDAMLADRMQHLRSHGITRDADKMESTSPGGWYYEQLELGCNYRLTDIQAALGLSQLQRLDKFISRRQEITKNYDQKLKDMPVILPSQHQDNYSACHLYVIQIDDTISSVSRKQVFHDLREAGILVNVHYIPVYMQPYYRKLKFQPKTCIEAEKYYARAITLPLFFALTDAQQDEVVHVLSKILQ
ncbi:MAG: UDP-4-amino-4,6-dideoxy-N-acetyl-beta-L-altrosamine transaminase [Gammaproteobacteria bacterium]|nr:UDP-4-amino-4,6-dideoxy-N-acetyl-beta-L-altrosamine transaminase [Gammaproteobacteria bacterium]